MSGFRVESVVHWQFSPPTGISCRNERARGWTSGVLNLPFDFPPAVNLTRIAIDNVYVLLRSGYHAVARDATDGSSYVCPKLHTLILVVLFFKHVVFFP